MAERKNYSGDGRSAEDRAFDKFCELIIDKLQTIQSDWKKPWFTQGISNSLPKNLSGREYNGMNSVMLMLHAEKMGYELPVWCTFDRVTAMNLAKDKQGRSSEAKDAQGNALPHVGVNKGEKSFPVFITTFTVIDPETKEKIKYDDYKRMTEEQRKKYSVYPRLQVYNVFNVSQTNIKEARPELWQKLVDQNNQPRPEVVKDGEQFSFPAMDHMIEHNEWICPIKPTYGDGACYSISKNMIVVPEKEQFKNGESFYANLAHEMAHSTGAEQHLNRLKPTSFGSAEYAREELVAELTAALTSQRYGMEKCIKEDSVPYLKNWLDSLKEEPAFIKNVLQDVKKASHMIHQRIDEVQMKLDTAQEQTQQADVKEGQQTTKDLGTYEIPTWSLPYILNDDASGISDKEKDMVDKFLDVHFPNGFIPDVIEESKRELNRYPAFGERNEDALARRGESPFLAVDTVSVKFSEAGYFESKSEGKDDGYNYQTFVDNTKEGIAAKMPPKQEEEESTGYRFHR